MSSAVNHRKRSGYASHTKVDYSRFYRNARTKETNRNQRIRTGVMGNFFKGLLKKKGDK